MDKKQINSIMLNSKKILKANKLAEDIETDINKRVVLAIKSAEKRFEIISPLFKDTPHSADIIEYINFCNSFIINDTVELTVVQAQKKDFTEVSKNIQTLSKTWTDQEKAAIKEIKASVDRLLKIKEEAGILNKKENDQKIKELTSQTELIPSVKKFIGLDPNNSIKNSIGTSVKSGLGLQKDEKILSGKGIKRSLGFGLGGLMHIAGFLTDAPALNMLASSYNSRRKSKIDEEISAIKEADSIKNKGKEELEKYNFQKKTSKINDIFKQASSLKSESGFKYLSTVPNVAMAGGGSMVTSGPTKLTVGDNPGGRELVTTVPLSGIGKTKVNGNEIKAAGGGQGVFGSGIDQTKLQTKGEKIIAEKLSRNNAILESLYKDQKNYNSIQIANSRDNDLKRGKALTSTKPLTEKEKLTAAVKEKGLFGGISDLLKDSLQTAIISKLVQGPGLGKNLAKGGLVAGGSVFGGVGGYKAGDWLAEKTGMEEGGTGEKIMKGAGAVGGAVLGGIGMNMLTKKIPFLNSKSVAGAPAGSTPVYVVNPDDISSGINIPGSPKGKGLLNTAKNVGSRGLGLARTGLGFLGNGSALAGAGVLAAGGAAAYGVHGTYKALTTGESQQNKIAQSVGLVKSKEDIASGKDSRSNWNPLKWLGMPADKMMELTVRATTGKTAKLGEGQSPEQIRKFELIQRLQNEKKTSKEIREELIKSGFITKSAEAAKEKKEKNKPQEVILESGSNKKSKPQEVKIIKTPTEIAIEKRKERESKLPIPVEIKEDKEKLAAEEKQKELEEKEDTDRDVTEDALGIEPAKPEGGLFQTLFSHQPTPATSIPTPAVYSPSTPSKSYAPDTGPAPTGLGGISAKFETGGKANSAGMVSSGKGDFGGKSYGTYQFASKNGSLNKFLDQSGYGKAFAGKQVGSVDFDQTWKELAKDPKFAEAQEHYIKRNYYDVQFDKLQKAGIDLSNRSLGVKQAIWSTAVQYGSGTGIIKKALANQDLAKMTDAQIIDAIQNYKAANVQNNFKSSSAGVQASISNRIEQERNLLKKSSDSPAIAIAQGKEPPQQVAVAFTNKPVSNYKPETKGSISSKEIPTTETPSQPIAKSAITGVSIPSTSPADSVKASTIIASEDHPTKQLQMNSVKAAAVASSNNRKELIDAIKTSSAGNIINNVSSNTSSSSSTGPIYTGDQYNFASILSRKYA